MVACPLVASGMAQQSVSNLAIDTVASVALGSALSLQATASVECQPSLARTNQKPKAVSPATKSDGLAKTTPVPCTYGLKESLCQTPTTPSITTTAPWRRLRTNTHLVTNLWLLCEVTVCCACNTRSKSCLWVLRHMACVVWGGQ